MGQLKKRFPRYDKLLYLYPAGYRRTYGEQMLQTLADMLDDPERSRFGIWTRTTLDFPFSVIKQQLSYTGEAMTTTTPTYVKRSGLVGALLLAPFLLSLIANGLDKVINNRTLYNSWLWHMPVLAIWVLWLPAVAALLTLISLVAFLVERSRVEHTSWFKQLLDIRHNWPVFGVALAGLFILALVLFHDSVHCVAGNPIRELHNPSQTWRCIEQR